MCLFMFLVGNLGPRAQGEGKWACVCVCVCVCEREREREKAAFVKVELITSMIWHSSTLFVFHASPFRQLLLLY